MTKKASTLAAALLLIQPASALEIRSYSAARHDRFLNFPGNPTQNPNFLYAQVDLTGVGWYLVPSNQTLERQRIFPD